jgi:hypothetical protein
VSIRARQKEKKSGAVLGRGACKVLLSARRSCWEVQTNPESVVVDICDKRHVGGFAGATACGSESHNTNSESRKGSADNYRISPMVEFYR